MNTLENTSGFPIFFIGFNKTATSSIEAMLQTKYKVVHWDNKITKMPIIDLIDGNLQNGLPILHGIDFEVYLDIMDDNHLDLYKKLYQEHPNSKYVLQIRSKEKWILSRLNFYLGQGVYYHTFCNTYYKQNLTWQQYITKWSKMYDEYVKEVKDFFVNKPNFFVYDIEKMTHLDLLEFLKPQIELVNPKLEDWLKTNNYFKKFNLDDIEPFL